MIWWILQHTQWLRLQDSRNVRVENQFTRTTRLWSKSCEKQDEPKKKKKFFLLTLNNTSNTSRSWFEIFPSICKWIASAEERTSGLMLFKMWFDLAQGNNGALLNVIAKLNDPKRRWYQLMVLSESSGHVGKIEKQTREFHLIFYTRNISL